MKLPSKSRVALIEEECFHKLRTIGQEHLVNHWHALSSQQKERLARQIAHLDNDLFLRQQAFLQETAVKPISIEPFPHVFFAENSKNESLGHQLAEEGKVALLILAGGQGSRLRCNGPKGLFPITAIRHKSLFQFLSEKIRAASKQMGRCLEVAIMTSPLNHVETVTFFNEHAFFGLDPKSIHFIYQKMWPLLNFEGNLFLEEVDQVAVGPNGNGGVFQILSQSGVLKKWESMGIEYVQCVPVDNPLAFPFDPQLIGFHAKQKNDITIQAVQRSDPLEQAGVLALVNEKPTVAEYSELADAEKEARDFQGNLKFGLTNIGLYCFSLSFLNQACAQQLPFHLAKKAVKRLDENAVVTFPDMPNAIKFEEFIFDAFPSAEQVQALVYPRQWCFAPLKNLKGGDSPETVRQALLTWDRTIFAKITGNEPPSTIVFELAPQFYYPTEELLQRWKGKPFPNQDYIYE